MLVQTFDSGLVWGLPTVCFGLAQDRFRVYLG